MHPLIKQQIKQVAKGLDDLKAELARTREQLEAVTAAKDELQKKSWAQAKELALHKQELEELAGLRRENKRLAELRGEFEERLRRILDYSEALGAEFRER